MTINKNNTTASLIVQEVQEWLGTPYRHQGSRKGIGCDCLGLVRGVWKNIYRVEPEPPEPYSPDWAETGRQDIFLQAAQKYCLEKKIEDRCPGDLLLFRWRSDFPAKHAAILVSHERFIHACEGRCVTAASLVPQWVQRLAGVFSFPEQSKG